MFQFAVLMWLLTYVGALFNGLTLLILGEVIPILAQLHFNSNKLSNTEVDSLALRHLMLLCIRSSIIFRGFDEQSCTTLMSRCLFQLKVNIICLLFQCTLDKCWEPCSVHTRVPVGAYSCCRSKYFNMSHCFLHASTAVVSMFTMPVVYEKHQVGIWASQ